MASWDGGGFQPSRGGSKLVPSPEHVQPDTEQNVIDQTEDVFKNFLYQSWRQDRDKEEFDATPSVPQFTSNFTADPLSDISLETSVKDVYNAISHDRIGQEWNEIFQTVEFTPAAQVGRRLAKIGDDINQKYQGEFDTMINSLNIDESTAYEAFAGVAKKLLSGGIHWGRILTLFSFGYRIAVRVLGFSGLGDFARALGNVIRNVVRFITDTSQGIVRWIANQGGWMSAQNYVPSLSWPVFIGIFVSAAAAVGTVFYLRS